MKAAFYNNAVPYALFCILFRIFLAGEMLVSFFKRTRVPRCRTKGLSVSDFLLQPPDNPMIFNRPGNKRPLSEFFDEVASAVSDIDNSQNGTLSSPSKARVRG